MNSSIKHIILMLTFSIVSFVSFAQKPVLETAIDTAYIRIGEQFNYKIKVANTSKVEFPAALENLQNIEQLESRIDTLKNYLVKRYLLTSFDSGSFKIPRQQVFIQNRKYLTDSLLIHVATVKVNTIKQNLYPIKAIQNEPKTWVDYKKYVWWLLPIFLFIAGIIYYFIQKNKQKEAIVKYINPYEKAVSQLQLLDKKPYLEKNEIKQYYIELTDILRTFIEGETKIPALESTTDELLETISDFRKIKKLKIKSSVVKQLANLLKEADLVKFAKYKPHLEEIESHRKTTSEIIEKLKPKTTEHVEQ